MNVNFILLIIFCLLMCFIGGQKGRTALVALFFNLLFMFVMLLLINWGFPPLVVTLITSLSVTAMNLFFINDIQPKTTVAFLSSFIILILMTALIFLSVDLMHLQGMPAEELMEMDMYSLTIGISFIYLSISVLIMSVVGAINDVAISITSAINELHNNNPNLTKSDLFHSGMTIGKDVLGSTMNTLIFALFGGQLALLVWVSDLNYSFAQFMNTKILVTEWVALLISGISITLTIPLTTFLMVYTIKKA